MMGKEAPRRRQLPEIIMAGYRSGLVWFLRVAALLRLAFGAPLIVLAVREIARGDGWELIDRLSILSAPLGIIGEVVIWLAVAEILSRSERSGMARVIEAFPLRVD